MTNLELAVQIAKVNAGDTWKTLSRTNQLDLIHKALTELRKKQ